MNRDFDSPWKEVLHRYLPQFLAFFFPDIGNDVDDALALAMLHALESRGECRLIAVTITKDNPWAAAYVDLVNTFYGRARIPIGMVKTGGITPERSPMIQAPDCEPANSVRAPVTSNAATSPARPQSVTRAVTQSV